MHKLPINLKSNYTQQLIDINLSKPEQYFCTKWLQYYWDFSYKYHHDPFLSSSLPLFLGKLQEKKQSVQQQTQARFSVNLLYKMNSLSPGPDKPAVQAIQLNPYQIQENQRNNNFMVKGNDQSEYNSTSSKVSRTLQSKPASGQSWVPVFEQLENEIKRRHYSPKTLKAYCTWTRQFQGYTKSKDYQHLYRINLKVLG